MLPRTHVLVGLFFSLVLYLLFPLGITPILIFFFASFLIDADHYIYYVAKKKSFNLKKSYFWFKDKSKRLKKIPREERGKYSTGFYLFHGVEVIAFFSLLGIFVHFYFFFISLGSLLHLSLDWIEKFSNSKIHPYKVSLLYDLYKYPQLKKI